MPFTLQENVTLAPFTTLGIGGAARYFITAQIESDIIEALAFARARDLPVFILGGGSNVLIADEGFAGLVIHINLRGVKFQEDGLVTAAAGESWDDFVAQCVTRNLTGIECLSGIPGTVGGTPVQNVGAYGQEVSQTIVSVRAYDRVAQELVELSNAECQFGYRTSRFNTVDRERFIVLSVRFALSRESAPALLYPDLQKHFALKDEPPTLAEIRQAVLAIRASKGMVLDPLDADTRSAGSFFKSPGIAESEYEALAKQFADKAVPRFAASAGHSKVPAAWLIEQAGFAKGYALGQAGISSKHTLALINRGGATARDVIELMQAIQQGVAQKFGIALQPEPVFIGFNNSALASEVR